MRVDQVARSTVAAGTAKPREGRSSSTGTGAGRDVADVAELMGIPVTELSPNAQTAITQLMTEVGALRETIAAQNARVAQLEQLADQDSLTPVANRRAFVRELARLASAAKRYGEESSVIYFDVNGLKDINDRFGHAAGDAAIVRVADLLLESVRDSDLVGRLGGDEFGVLLSHTGPDRAQDKAETLSARVAAETLEWQGASIPLKLAYGVHTLANGEDAGDALAAADRAMYVNKRGA